MDAECSEAQLTSLNQELENLRATIRRRRNTVLHPKGCQETRYQLDSAEEQYNTLSDRIALLSRSPLSDPLDIFPEEIWQEIVYETGITDLMPYKYALTESRLVISVEHILPLALVSTRWRLAILNCPLLWSTLILQPEIEDLEAKIFLSIVLSRDLPLTVIIDEVAGSTTLWDTCGHYIIPQKHRIRGLILYYYVKPDSILGSIGEMSLLETLHVDKRSWVPSMDDIKVIQSADSIRSMTGLTCTAETTLQMSSLKRIRTLEVNNTIGECLPILESLPLLEDVGFVRDSSRRSQSGKSINIISWQHPLPWKYFKFQGFIDEIINTVLKRVFSTLTKLTVRTHWKEVPKLLISCKDMPQLSSLDLRATQGYSDEGMREGFQRQELTPSRIRDFSLWSFMPSRASFDETGIAILTENLEVLMPNVQRLRLYCEGSACAPYLKYVCSLKSLKSATLILDPIDRQTEFSKYREETDSEYIGVIKTEELVIHTARRHLEIVQTSGVLSLKYVENPPSRFPAGRLMASEWRDLQKLSVRFDVTNWEDISLTRLLKIEFVGADDIELLASGFNALCQQIAISPRIFPSLEYIRSVGVPEWDTLFIMLERRNLSLPLGGPESISSIKCLELDGFPPIEILKPLTSLLGRRFASRPTNRSISLVGIAETLFDSQVSGCVRCHLALQACTFKQAWKSLLNCSPSENFFNYPESYEEILATRAQRQLEWETIVQKIVAVEPRDRPGSIPMGVDCRRNHTVKRCSNVTSYVQVEINEHTLHEVSFDS